MKQERNEYWILCLDGDGRVVGPPVGATNSLVGFDAPFRTYDEAEELAEAIIEKRIAVRYTIVKVVGTGQRIDSLTAL